MYIVVRESLNLSPGKLAAQVGHGVEAVLMAHWHRPLAELPLLAQWRATGSRKVVLEASDPHFERVVGWNPAVIVDEGHTEVPAGTETVAAFFPMRKSERPSILKRLRCVNRKDEQLADHPFQPCWEEGRGLVPGMCAHRDSRSQQCNLRPELHPV